MSNNILNDISKVYLEQVVNSETELEEGMTMRDFKKQRSRQKQKEKRAAEKTSPLRRAGIHADKASPERAARHRANVDPDFEGNDERNYPGGKLRPNKVRKAKALGELGESSHLETDMKKRREANEKAVEDMKKTAAYKSMAATAAKKFDESVVGDRARNAVSDQRLDDVQRDTQSSVDKLKKGNTITRAGAHIAAKKVERMVRNMHPKPGTTGAYRIEDPKPNGSKPGAYRMEALDPVGKEDADIDNDGKPNTKKDKYLMHRRNVIKQEIATQKEAKEVNDGNLANNYPPYDKVTRGDIIAGALGQDQMGGKKKKKVTKEGYSNWRQDLAEVITKDQNQTPIKEKKVENKIIINPPMKIGEAVSNLGGELVEMVEFEGVLDEFHDSELMFLSNELIEEVVEEFFYECVEEGYEIAEVEDILIESIEISSSILNEAKVTLGHDTKIERKNDKLEKVKSAVKKVARGVGYAAGAAVRGAKAIGREVKAGYAAGRGSDSSSSSSSGTRKPQPYRNTHQQSKKPGLLSRLGSKLKSGLKKAVASGARAVSRGARNIARKMEDGGSSSTSKSTPAAKKPAEKPTDPWEGSATTPPKAKTSKAKTPTKKKKSKLDDLLADIRKESKEVTALGSRLIDTYDKAPYSDYEASSKDSAKMVRKAKALKGVVRKEEIKLDEKTLTSAETKKKEEIVKSMKKNLAGFRARYGDRAKEVMYATATKQAKKVAEQASEIAPKTQSATTKPDPTAAARQKQLVQIQKKQTMDRMAQLNKGIPLTN